MTELPGGGTDAKRTDTTHTIQDSGDRSGVLKESSSSAHVDRTGSPHVNFPSICDNRCPNA